MTFFTEIDWAAHRGGRIASVQDNSLAADLDLQPGDELLAINDNKVVDVIDVQYYAAEEYLELLVRRQDEYFLFEAVRTYNQPLGIEFEHPTFDIDIRRCNNLCEFCFVLQMAPRFRRTLYIKDDDYRYSFLFGHYITLTNLNDHDWWRIETMRLSPLYVSIHVTDVDRRRAFLRNQSAPDVLDQLRRFSEKNIDIHTQIVVVPGFNDGVWLERSIRELAALWPTVLSVSVVPVGLTKHHRYGMRPHLPFEAAAMIDYLESTQLAYRKKFGVRFVYPTDEWYLVAGRQVPPASAYDGQELHENGLGMVRAFLDEWQDVKREIADSSRVDYSSCERLFLVTGSLFAPTLRETAGDFSDLTGRQVIVVPIVNERLGSTITAAGLLMAEDILAQLPDSVPKDLIVLPRVMFDHPDAISLDNISPQEIADRLDRMVLLADQMGDIWDALTGRSRVLFEPHAR